MTTENHNHAFASAHAGPIGPDAFTPLPMVGSDMWGGIDMTHKPSGRSWLVAFTAATQCQAEAAALQFRFGVDPDRRNWTVASYEVRTALPVGEDHPDTV